MRGGISRLSNVRLIETQGIMSSCPVEVLGKQAYVKYGNSDNIMAPSLTLLMTCESYPLIRHIQQDGWLETNPK